MSTHQLSKPFLLRRRRRWTREAVVASIETLRETGADLSYSGVAEARGSLHSAGVRLFGAWHAALVAAGVNPATVRRRRRWTSEAVVQRIRQLADSGADLSWTAVAHGPDRALAAAAVKQCRFGAWETALSEAGIRDTSPLRRTRRWDARTIRAAILARRQEGLAVNAKAVERDEPALIAAARRRFGSWSGALEHAGIDPELVSLRRSSSRGVGGAKADACGTSGSAAVSAAEGE